MKLTFREFVVEHFAKKAHDEQMGGGRGDAGQDRAMQLVQAHALGAQGRLLDVVPAFTDLFKEYQKQRDPDYATYLELKKKFDD
jgi:hypothetical protein